MKKYISLSALSVALVASLSGDVVNLKDGSRLVGEIDGIHEEMLRLETSFAGTLEVKLAEVTSFSSDDAETIRTSDGNVLVGSVSTNGIGSISVTTAGGAVTVDTTSVKAAWAPGDRDPAEVAIQAGLASQIRRWSFEATASVAGKTGNTKRFNTALTGKAALEGPNDRFEIYGKYEYGKENNTESADEAQLGLSYTSYFGKKIGWYIREQVEYDTFQDLDFRSTTAFGLSYRFFKEKTHSLEGRAGLSYRYDSYLVGTPSTADYPGLDFGLQHYWKFAKWGEMTNVISYVPSVDDFGDYRIEHTSNVDIPLAFSDFWKFRIGLSNQYDSSPSGTKKELDTTYSLSLLLNWK